MVDLLEGRRCKHDASGFRQVKREISRGVQIVFAFICLLVGKGYQLLARDARVLRSWSLSQRWKHHHNDFLNAKTPR